MGRHGADFSDARGSAHPGFLGCGSGSPASLAAPSQDLDATYDLVIKGDKVIYRSQGISAELDVALIQ